MSGDTTRHENVHFQRRKETTVGAGLAPACMLAARTSNEHDAMHRTQSFLIALKKLLLLGRKQAGASPAPTVVVSRFAFP
ncbi:hypothetical protein [Dictyobacter halimunensis]|uniref:hypothetical protein n=1 Tax=Dictyobacter halimunensis TaxID=3026934 RepID=UPI0030C70135